MISSKDFHFDDVNKYVEIAGLKYAYSLFEAWGVDGMTVGVSFEIYSRDDGALSIAVKGEASVSQ